ncbi:NUDIX hydrolase [Candidatus Uhrbacteria bacterium]|nr:NUDIX hydrolase [Candidatus Uhrbacteria bacterium]
MEKEVLQGHQVACSAFIEKGGKFLAVFDPGFRVWRVPGGRPEWGETVEETLIREMREETSIQFEQPRFLGFGQDQQFHIVRNKETSRVVLYFHVKTDKEPLLDPEEAQDHRWVSLEEMKKLNPIEGALVDFFQRFPDAEKQLND